MGIGSFLWYWLERTQGFSSEKLPHPARAQGEGPRRLGARRGGRRRRRGRDRARPGAHGADLPAGRSATRRSRSRRASAPGPVQLSTLAHFRGGPGEEPLRAVARARRRVPRRDRRARRGRLQAHPARGPRRVDAAPVRREGLRLGQRDRRSHDGGDPARASSARGTSAWATRGATSSRA